MVDEHFIIAIQLRFDQIKPFSYMCPCDQIDLISLTPEAFTEHILACKHCGGSHNILRHELIVHEVKKVLHFHHIASSWPTDLQRPGCSKGGPDLLVFTLTNIDAVDVAVSKDRPIQWFNVNKNRRKHTLPNSNKIFSKKLGSYTEFAKRTEMRTVPFVMSVYGTYAESTLDLLEQWFELTPRPHSLRHSLFSRTQMQLIRGISLGLSRLASRTFVDPNLDDIVRQRTPRPNVNVMDEEREPAPNGGLRSVPLADVVRLQSRSETVLTPLNGANVSQRR